MPSQSAPKPPGPHAASGVAGGMRRRPIDVTRKLPLVRSQKELVLDEETSVQAVAVSEIPTLIRFPPSFASQAPFCAGAMWHVPPPGGSGQGGGRLVRRLWPWEAALPGPRHRPGPRSGLAGHWRLRPRQLMALATAAPSQHFHPPLPASPGRKRTPSTRQSNRRRSKTSPCRSRSRRIAARRLRTSSGRNSTSGAS